MPRILIVDDSADNRQVLRDALETQSYTYDEAADGQAALAAVRRNPPDVILLDLMMPGMDGLACCRQLKADKETEPIPVIMVTALNNDEQVLAAFEAGATDFIAKPYSYPIVMARVRAAVHAKIAHDRLETRNREILQLAFATTHDLQTPLISVLGAVESLDHQFTDATDERVSRWMHRIRSNTKRMSGMLQDLMVFASAGSETLRHDLVNLADVAKSAVDAVRDTCEQKGIATKLDIEDCLVRGDAHVLHRVLCNVVGNAAKYIENSAGGRITVTVSRAGDTVRVVVSDNGPGIAPSKLQDVFLPFRRATTREKGTGLGLSIVKRYVEAFDGTVHLESDGVCGTTAVIEFPTANANGAAHAPLKAA